MQKILSVPGLINYYAKCPSEVQTYFKALPTLLESVSLDVSLAYVFSRVETAHNWCLYCGIVKLHRVDSGLAKRAVQTFHMSREGFRQMFQIIYNAAIPDPIVQTLVIAEAVRDNVLHGKGAEDKQLRNAIAHALEYAIMLNEHTQKLKGPKPFGDLRGFAGAASSLEKTTSRWVLKGMGFKM